MSRYTPKHSITALYQKWMTVDELDPRLNQIGRILAKAADDGLERFSQVARELMPEKDIDV